MFDVHEYLGGVLAASGEVCVLSEAFLLQFSVAELQMKPLFYYSKKKGNSWFYRMDMDSLQVALCEAYDLWPS